MKKLIQASTLNALMLGNFDETVKVKDFLRQADTGIGTYTGLDGRSHFRRRRGLSGHGGRYSHRDAAGRRGCFWYSGGF